MPALFDPLAWLSSKGVTPYIALDGSLRLRWGDRPPRFGVREDIRLFIAPYQKLLRMQLDVSEGVKPRTVQQLIAAGKIVLRKGRYVLVEENTFSSRIEPD